MRGWEVLLPLVLTACGGREPSFTSERLSAATDPDVARSRVGAEPTRSRVLPSELETMISTEPLPEPFWPDDGARHYAPPPAPEAGFEDAIRTAAPRLVDVVSVERSGGDTIVHATAIPSGRDLTITLPSNYSCTSPGTVETGRRYLLLTEHHPDATGGYPLYTGPGSYRSISLVSAAGTVRVANTERDAAEIVASFGGES